EQRLRDASYNLREAYAIYCGLCEYAYEGRPTQTPPEVRVENGNVRVTTTLSEGLPVWWGSDRTRILRSSIAVTWNGTPLSIGYDPATKVLTATGRSTPPATSLSTRPAENDLRIHFANMFKHHNWPQRYAATLTGNAATVEATRMPKAIPSFDRGGTGGGRGGRSAS